MSTEEQSNLPRNFTRCTVRFCIFAVLLIVVLAVSWFVFGIVTDGIDARLIVLDSCDAERTKIWKAHYTNEALRGWAIPGLGALGVIFIFCRGLVRSAREAWESLQ